MAPPSLAADRFRSEVAAPPPNRAEAAAYCLRMMRGHYENFTVASWLLPRPLVPHMAAIYAYCRFSDDLADEVASPAESLALLDAWQDELERCYSGRARHPVFVALGETIREFSIPPDPFEQLLVAFRQDQQVARYETVADLLEYCRHSANPVGRLVLYLGRCHDAERGSLADAICTGLQWINFCQDVARDWQKGRVYLPQETLERFGYDEAMFARGEFNQAFAGALRTEVDRAESFLHAGDALVGRVPPSLAFDVALFAAGGLEVVRGIRQLDYNVWHRRPVVSKWSRCRLVLGCWWRTRHIAGRSRG
jgi:squalene synthase HpnC